MIVASSECMLNKQRRGETAVPEAVRGGERMVRERFGVDEDVCTGDHACIRLSGCPSLSVKHTDDLLKDDPVAAIDNTCVGCGNCGEVAEAAVLCPSFYRADIIHNPTWFDRFVSGLRRSVIGFLQRRREAHRIVLRTDAEVRHHERSIGNADADQVHDRTANLYCRYGHGRPGRRRTCRLDRRGRRVAGLACAVDLGLLQFGIKDDIIVGIEADVRRRVDEATEKRKAAPMPPADILTCVYRKLRFLRIGGAVRRRAYETRCARSGLNGTRDRRILVRERCVRASL